MKGIPVQTATQQIEKFLRQNPGRHNNVEIAEALDMPIGTVSSVTAVEYRGSLQHRGAGIDAFKSDNARNAVYAWCHS